MEADMTGFFRGKDTELKWKRIGKRNDKIVLPPYAVCITLYHTERLDESTSEAVVKQVRAAFLSACDTHTRKHFRNWSRLAQARRGDRSVLRLEVKSLFYS